MSCPTPHHLARQAFDDIMAARGRFLRAVDPQLTADRAARRDRLSPLVPMTARGADAPVYVPLLARSIAAEIAAPPSASHVPQIRT
jgi:hypothetical protein